MSPKQHESTSDSLRVGGSALDRKYIFQDSTIFLEELWYGMTTQKSSRRILGWLEETKNQVKCSWSHIHLFHWGGGGCGQNPTPKNKLQKPLFALQFGQQESHFKGKHVYLLTITVLKYQDPPVRSIWGQIQFSQSSHSSHHKKKEGKKKVK